MERNEIGRGTNGSKRDLTTGELVSQAIDRTQALLREEIALAKAETRQQIQATVKMGAGLGVAAACAWLAVLSFVTAAIAAISTGLPVWASALIIGGALLLIAAVAGAVGWARRPRKPLERTLRTTKEDITWAKDRIS